jgi:dTDP-4-dehydrorhamnose reductase
MSLRLLITGANGQVGWHLQRTLAPLGEVTALTREQLDLSDLDAVAAAVRKSAADIVVNAGAYTAVDKAESEPELANAINAAAPVRMAQELARSGGLLIHYSTDYVFDGSKPGAYTEDDATAPLNAYGRSKLAGEQGIAGSGCAHIILRTTWLYDIRGKNFLKTVLRLAREREELRMVGDQYGAPTWARTVAEATAGMVARSFPGSAAGTGQRGRAEDSAAERSGIFHLTAGGRTSWAEFAEAIIAEYEDCSPWPGEPGAWNAPLMVKRVVAIKSEEYQTPARRPQNSVLNNDKVKAVFGVVMPEWRGQLRLAMQDTIRG